MKIVKFVAILILLSVGSSCQDDSVAEVNSVSDEYVPVQIDVRVAREVMINTEPTQKTRAIQDTEGLIGIDEIKNLWVIQFNGTTDDALLVGRAHYISNYADLDQRKFQLVASTKENTLVFLANTFNEQLLLPQGMTLAELKALKKVISRPSDVFGYDVNTVDADKEFPDNADYYLQMCGMMTTSISSGATINAELQRNACRVDLLVKNSIPDEITIDDITLKNVPMESYYFTSYVDHDGVFPEEYSFKVMDYSKIDWANAENGSEQNEKKFRFYLPANLRGVKTNTEPTYKNALASRFATYVLITGHYQDGDEKVALSYTFYLGRDMSGDFNLIPNYAYTYHFDIQAKGNPDIDARVGNWSMKSFLNDERANCYILNPPVVEGAYRKFRIPIDRIETFWGNHGYEDVPNNALDPQKGYANWETVIIWSDFLVDNTNFQITKSTGNSYQDYFEVKVKNGVQGNVVLGVRRPGDVYLWSWHLWITDYNPYAYQLQPYEGQYIYPTLGGNLHRYGGKEWTSGKYQNQFVMDRDIGALTDKYSDTEKGHVCYQYGRKDPLPASSWYEGGKTYHPSTEPLSSVRRDETGTTPVGDNMLYAMMHPLEVILGPASPLVTNDSYWIYNSKYSSADNWLDPFTTTGKSIFDPSPAGYKVTPKDVFSDDFTDINNAKPTTNRRPNGMGELVTQPRNFPDIRVVKSLCYWPYGAGEDVPSELIEFPSTICRAGAPSKVLFQRILNEKFIGTIGYIQALNAEVYGSLILNVGSGNGLPARCVTYNR